jgi:tetratricopeptide (TPR) repeat protein
LRKDEENYHKNCTTHEQTFGFDPYFDPIRAKLRVMPIDRAPQIQGKTADFYFIQASNLCLRNNLPHAIESLTKGLAIQPDHLLCRFNHGALMFKLGLMSQARRDFEMLSPRYPKELAAHFNLALTLLQLGEYDKALDAADIIVKAAQKADSRQ